MILEGKRILVTGGTGSLGRVLVGRLLSGELGTPRKVVVFSRDEAKQDDMRREHLRRRVTTDESIYRSSRDILEFRIGDVRDYSDVRAAARDADVVFNAAALKQVPTCEYFPEQAIRTNCEGPANLVRAVLEGGAPVEAVVGISTDKACKPVNVMGMTKALQERIFTAANLSAPKTRFICVRYGNVLASRGSVIPLFLDQIRAGGPVTITSPEMTRFLLTIDQAVDTVFAALREALPGETWIPNIPSATVANVARALIGDRKIETKVTGVRPGEKIHEILVSEEEVPRTVRRGAGYYSILPMLPDLRRPEAEPPALAKEFSSADNLVDLPRTAELLRKHRLRVEDTAPDGGELLR
jgi:UDP-glucose 4-epimerase